MLVVEGFQKFAGIPFCTARIFESLMPQLIGANRRKNRSIQGKLNQLLSNNFLNAMHIKTKNTVYPFFPEFGILVNSELEDEFKHLLPAKIDEEKLITKTRSELDDLGTVSVKYKPNFIKDFNKIESKKEQEQIYKICFKDLLEVKRISEIKNLKK